MLRSGAKQDIAAESFGEGCCSGSRRIPRRGAAVLRKARRSKYTFFRHARVAHAARFQRDPLSFRATIRALHDDAETARFDAFIQSTDQHARDRIAFAECHSTMATCPCHTTALETASIRARQVRTCCWCCRRRDGWDPNRLVLCGTKAPAA